MTISPGTQKVENYYRILQVSPYATPGAVHDAYRTLSLRLRAAVDDNPGAFESLRKLDEAYEVLRDDVRRAAYDVEFARQSASGELTDIFNMCAACEELSKKMYVRRAPPCEWCEDRFATMCVPRPDHPEDALHLWLCERCFNQSYFSA